MSRRIGLAAFAVVLTAAGCEPDGPDALPPSVFLPLRATWTADQPFVVTGETATFQLELEWPAQSLDGLRVISGYEDGCYMWRCTFEWLEPKRRGRLSIVTQKDMWGLSQSASGVPELSVSSQLSVCHDRPDVVQSCMMMDSTSARTRVLPGEASAIGVAVPSVRLGVGEERLVQPVALALVGPLKRDRVRLPSAVLAASSNERVFTVDARGQLVGIGVGTAELRLTSGRATRRIPVEVVDVPLTPAMPPGFVRLGPSQGRIRSMNEYLGNFRASFQTVAIDARGSPLFLTQGSTQRQPQETTDGVPALVLSKWTGTGFSSEIVSDWTESPGEPWVAVDGEGREFVGYATLGEPGPAVVVLDRPASGGPWRRRLLPLEQNPAVGGPGPVWLSSFESAIFQTPPIMWVLPVERGVWVAYGFFAEYRFPAPGRRTRCEVSLRLSRVTDGAVQTDVVGFIEAGTEGNRNVDGCEYSRKEQARRGFTWLQLGLLPNGERPAVRTDVGSEWKARRDAPPPLWVPVPGGWVQQPIAPHSSPGPLLQRIASWTPHVPASVQWGRGLEGVSAAVISRSGRAVCDLSNNPESSSGRGWRCRRPEGTWESGSNPFASDAPAWNDWEAYASDGRRLAFLANDAADTGSGGVLHVASIDPAIETPGGATLELGLRTRPDGDAPPLQQLAALPDGGVWAYGTWQAVLSAAPRASSVFLDSRYARNLASHPPLEFVSDREQQDSQRIVVQGGQLVMVRASDATRGVALFTAAPGAASVSRVAQVLPPQEGSLNVMVTAVVALDDDVLALVSRADGAPELVRFTRSSGTWNAARLTLPVPMQGVQFEDDFLVHRAGLVRDGTRAVLAMYRPVSSMPSTLQMHTTSWSPVGGFSALRSAPLASAPDLRPRMGRLVVHGSSLVVPTTTRLLVSNDDGASWSATAGPPGSDTGSSSGHVERLPVPLADGRLALVYDVREPGPLGRPGVYLSVSDGTAWGAPRRLIANGEGLQSALAAVQGSDSALVVSLLDFTTSRRGDGFLVRWWPTP